MNTNCYYINKIKTEKTMHILRILCIINSVADPHHFYTALALGNNFEPASAQAPTLYSI
jgi:hypothetical protein